MATRDRLTQDYGGQLLGQTTRYAERQPRLTAKATRSVNEEAEAGRMLAAGKSQIETARILRVSRATIQRAYPGGSGRR